MATQTTKGAEMITVKHQRTTYSRPSMITDDGQTARVKLALTERQLARVLEALHNERDPFGTEADAFESALQTHQHNLDDYNRKQGRSR